MVAGTLRQPGQFAPQADAAAVLWKPRPEHVRDVHQLGRTTDGAVAWGWLADLASGPDEFGVGIADFGAIEHAGAVVGEHRRAGEPVVDVTLGITRSRWRHAKHSGLIVGASGCSLRADQL